MMFGSDGTDPFWKISATESGIIQNAIHFFEGKTTFALNAGLEICTTWPSLTVGSPIAITCIIFGGPAHAAC